MVVEGVVVLVVMVVSIIVQQPTRGPELPVAAFP